ncbi:MAG: YlmH/Sll1252 family protein [Bacillota bacterium]
MSEIKNRLADLAGQSYSKNIYTFSDFLSESSLSEVEFVKFDAKKEEFGGCDFASRKMLRFGSDCFGSGEFPIKILHICPKSKKFAVEISHRDILGAVMSLGIVREKVGDIFTDGKDAYVVCESKIAKYICENLESVARNTVEIAVATQIPESFAPKTEMLKLSVASPRVDSVICKLYNISRESALELFRTLKVSVSSKATENNSKILQCGDVVSVRGFGKFKFVGEAGISKKGKTYVQIEKFV